MPRTRSFPRCGRWWAGGMVAAALLAELAAIPANPLTGPASGTPLTHPGPLTSATTPPATPHPTSWPPSALPPTVPLTPAALGLFVSFGTAVPGSGPAAGTSGPAVAGETIAGEPGDPLGAGAGSGSRAANAIPGVVLAAYHRAAGVAAVSTPGCGLTWWMLAGIGKVESEHAHNGQVDAAGTTHTVILGPILDGSNATAAIPAASPVPLDRPGAALEWERAVGPMQFLPATWAIYGRGGNPNNIDDATRAAARFLCIEGRDLSQPAHLAAALYRYNPSLSYVRAVLAWARTYAAHTTPTPPDATKRPEPALPAPDLTHPDPTRSSAAPAHPVHLRTPVYTSAPAGSAAAVAVAFATAQLGLPYMWGGNGPAGGDAGFDCSGLTHAAYSAAGTNTARTAQTQFDTGPRVPAGQPLQPGDLVFYGTPDNVHHVGLYIGHDQMVNAPTFGKPVAITGYHHPGADYLGATRPSAAPGTLPPGPHPSTPHTTASRTPAPTSTAPPTSAPPTTTALGGVSRTAPVAPARTPPPSPPAINNPTTTVARQPDTTAPMPSQAPSPHALPPDDATPSGAHHDPDHRTLELSGHSTPLQIVTTPLTHDGLPATPEAADTAGLWTATDHTPIVVTLDPDDASQLLQDRPPAGTTLIIRTGNHATTYTIHTRATMTPTSAAAQLTHPTHTLTIMLRNETTGQIVVLTAS